MATKINFGVTGISATANSDYFGIPISTTQAASANTVVPRGYYYIIVGTYGQLQLNIAGTWTNLAPVATGGLVYSDGATVSVTNTSSSATNSISFIPIRFME